MMYNKSVQSFDHAISLSQDLDWVKRRRAAVLVRKWSGWREDNFAVPVSQETRDGFRIPTFQASEDSGGTEDLPVWALSLEQDELKTEHRPSLARDQSLQQR